MFPRLLHYERKCTVNEKKQRKVSQIEFGTPPKNYEHYRFKKDIYYFYSRFRNEQLEILVIHICEQKLTRFEKVNYEKLLSSLLISTRQCFY